MDCAVLLFLLVVQVRCYSNGAITASCEDLRPGHSRINPQTEPAPFTVTADRSSFTPGQELIVNLQASASTAFSGFLLQAREEGSRTPLGSFTLPAGGAQLLTCNQQPNSAVSHTSESPKTFIQLKWRSSTSGHTKPIQFHASFVQNFQTFWVDVRSAALTVTEPSPAPPQSISSEGCGITKVCFSHPTDCDPAVSTGCYFMSAMKSSPSDAAVRYEMSGLSDGYISFGFSDDKMMGNDDIYICGIDGNGLVQLQHAFSTGRLVPQILPLGNVSDITASVQDRLISCSFTSMNPVSTQRTTSSNSSYHIMFAHGPSSNGKIQFHVETFISEDKVDISRPQLVSKAGRPHIIKAHGALMLIAWMTTGSLGMIVARYLKAILKGLSCWGKDIWFLVHVAVMSVTVAATIIAFILSFSHIRVWSGGAHPVLGCLVLILSVIQPTAALLRCGPQHPLRFLFNWCHAVNAVAVKALAVAAIFTGLKLIDSSMDQWLMKVMGGFVGWEALFFILFDVHFRWKVNAS
ncbi:hypothetical protein LDENG_00098530, partial [Lucifuga dentata]